MVRHVSTGLVMVHSLNAFHARNETLHDHGQLPQFHPRVDWPEHGTTTRRRLAAINANINWQNPPEAAQARQKIAMAYPGIAPMRPYNPTYKGVPWEEHVCTIHTLMTTKLQNARTSGRVTGQEMDALIRIVSYGMYHSMASLSGWRINSLDGGVRAPAAELSADMAAGTFCDPAKTATDYHDEMVGRRWLVAPVSFNDVHWVMTIFDRQLGQLFVFDCGGDDLRDLRLEGCVHLWARFLNFIGFPFHFQYFACPATALTPTKAAQSGYICIYWLMLTLRDQVGGYRIDPAAPGVLKKHLGISDYPPVLTVPSPDLAASDLYIRDWYHEDLYWVTSYDGFPHIAFILKCMLENELGIVTNDGLGKVFSGHDSNPSSPWQMISALLINAQADGPNAGDVDLPSNLFWRKQGGPQFALPKHNRPRNYLANAQRRHHRPVPGLPRYQILGNTAWMTQAPAGNPAVWTLQHRLTPDNPLRRPASGLILETTAVTPMPHANTDSCLNFSIDLANRAEELEFQTVQPPMRARLDNIEHVVQGNGVPAVQFDLVAEFLNEGHGAFVSIPINPRCGGGGGGGSGGDSPGGGAGDSDAFPPLPGPGPGPRHAPWHAHEGDNGGVGRASGTFGSFGDSTNLATSVDGDKGNFDQSDEQPRLGSSKKRQRNDDDGVEVKATKRPRRDISVLLGPTSQN